MEHNFIVYAFYDVIAAFCGTSFTWRGSMMVNPMDHNIGDASPFKRWNITYSLYS